MPQPPLLDERIGDFGVPVALANDEAGRNELVDGRRHVVGGDLAAERLAERRRRFGSMKSAGLTCGDLREHQHSQLAGVLDSLDVQFGRCGGQRRADGGEGFVRVSAAASPAELPRFRNQSTPSMPSGPKEAAWVPANAWKRRVAMSVTPR